MIFCDNALALYKLLKSYEKDRCQACHFNVKTNIISLFGITEDFLAQNLVKVYKHFYNDRIIMSIYHKSPTSAKMIPNLKNNCNSSLRMRPRSQTEQYASDFTSIKYKDNQPCKLLNEDDDRSFAEVLNILDEEDVMLADKSKTVTSDSESRLQQIAMGLETVADSKNKSKSKIRFSNQQDFKIKNPPFRKLVCNVTSSLKLIKKSLSHLSGLTNNNLENIRTSANGTSTLKLAETILHNNSNKLRQAQSIQKQGTGKIISNLSDSTKDVLPQSHPSRLITKGTQGEIVMVQKNDKYLVLKPRNQTDLVNHPVKSVVNVSLIKMNSNNNYQENEAENLDNNRRLNSRGHKLYNPPVLKKDFKRKPKAKAKPSTPIKSKTPRNPENVVQNAASERVKADTPPLSQSYINQYIGMVVTADVEPHPAGLVNKHKQPKRQAKKCQKVKIQTAVDLDAIEVVYSSVVRAPEPLKIKEINRQDTAPNKENSSPNVGTEKPKRKKYVKKQKVKRTAKSKANVITRQQSKLEHINEIDQPQGNVDSALEEQDLNYDPVMKAVEERLKSANHTNSRQNKKPRKYVVSKKTTSRRSFKRSRVDTVMREAIHDGYESLEDVSVNAVKRTKNKLANTLEEQDKGQSSSSSFLPELDIEVEYPVKSGKLELLTTSSDSEPNDNLRLMSTICSAEDRQGLVKNKKINIISNVLLTKRFEKQITPVAEQMNLDTIFDPNCNLEFEARLLPLSQIIETDEVDNGFESPVQNLPPTKDENMQGIATGHLEDRTEVIRSTIQTGLRACADIIKANLNLLISEPVATDDIQIHTILCKLDCLLDNHFKRN